VIALDQLPSAPAYAALAGLVAGESAGLPLPGEASLIAAAVLASQGHLVLPLVIAVAAAAAIVGDNVGYLIGRRGARWLLVRPGRWEQRRRRFLAQGEAFFDRHGGKAVFLARWLPALRVTGAWLAGAGRMSWPRFVLWNMLGGVTWAATIALAAYFFGKAASALVGAAGFTLLGVLAVVALGLVLVRRRRRSAAARRGSDPSADPPSGRSRPHEALGLVPGDDPASVERHR
jgi:membrane protein DedA with SNARE-associated domain